VRSAAAASGGATGECVADVGGSLCRAGQGSLLFHHTHARRAGSGGLCDSVGSGCDGDVLLWVMAAVVATA
jgi:hypothetical protein